MTIKNPRALLQDVMLGIITLLISITVYTLIEIKTELAQLTVNSSQHERRICKIEDLLLYRTP